VNCCVDTLENIPALVEYVQLNPWCS
jgi:hypothetical protein